jgi:hypothetical protein
MGLSPTTNLIMGVAAAQAAQSDAESARVRARIAEENARQAMKRAANVTTDSDLEDRLDHFAEENRRLLNGRRELLQIIKEKDALILEWMHSNEAFKRLARQYGKKLDVSDEQRQTDFDNNILDIAEEDPSLAHTKKVAGARTRLGKN